MSVTQHVASRAMPEGLNRDVRCEAALREVRTTNCVEEYL
jgi:hypothetical protein